MSVEDCDKVVYGVTVSIKEGKLTLNGTSTNAVDIWLNLRTPIKAGTYACFGYTDIWCFIAKELRDYTNRESILRKIGDNDTRTFTTTYDCNAFGVYFPKGITYDNVTVDLMLNKGTTALPYEPYAGQRVKLLYGSKNLFDEKAFSELSSVSEDTYNGENCYKLAPKGINNKIPFKAKAGETITLSMDIAAPNGMDMYWFAENADGTEGTNLGGIQVGADFKRITKTATLKTDAEYINIRCYAVAIYTPYYIKNIMLNKGTTALPYDKYFPLSKMNLFLKSRNLIPYPYVSGNIEKNGLTITCMPNGGIYVKGTCTKDTVYYLAVSKAWFSSYIFASVNQGGASKEGYSMSVMSPDEVPVTIPTTRIAYEKGGNSPLYLWFRSGATYDCTLYPMLNEGEPLPYEPPQEYPN